MRSPGSDDKVLHAALRIGETTVFASEGHAKDSPTSRHLARAHGTDAADAERLFTALAEGGRWACH